jgi:hypothetical protein
VYRTSKKDGEEYHILRKLCAFERDHCHFLPSLIPINSAALVLDSCQSRKFATDPIMDDHGNVLAILDIGPRGGVYDQRGLR